MDDKQSLQLFIYCKLLGTFLVELVDPNGVIVSLVASLVETHSFLARLAGG